MWQSRLLPNESGMVYQVCLDYWNSLVLELFEPDHNLDNPAAIANLMGLPIMRETLIYLSHLDHEVTEKQLFPILGYLYFFILLFCFV